MEEQHATYAHSKSMSHSPIISPSSIPNPNPSIMSTKQSDLSYASVGGYPFSIPGYSAFQPVSHATVTQSNNSLIQPMKSTDVLKSRYDYDPCNALNVSVASVSSTLATSMSSASQSSNLTSMQTISCVPLASTFSTASPITTAASMGSLPKVTSALSMPPISTITSEPSLSLPMPLSTSEEPLPLCMSTKTFIPSVQNTVSSMKQTPSTKVSLQHGSIEHSHTPLDVFNQRIIKEHYMSTMPQLTQQNIPTMQLVNESESSKLQLPIHHSISSIVKMPPDDLSRIASEPSIQSNTSFQRIPLTATSTVTNEAIQKTTLPTMQSMPFLEPRGMAQGMMSPDSMQPTIRSEEPIHQAVPLMPSIEPIHQAVPFMPNMPTDLTMQRMHLDYYVPSMSMLPTEMLMRRMQLFQYMHSLQAIASEPPISFIPNMPHFVTSLPQAQSTIPMQETIVERPNPTSAILSESPVSYKQSALTTTTSMAQSMQPMFDAQFIPATSPAPSESIATSQMFSAPYTSNMSKSIEQTTPLTIVTSDQTSTEQMQMLLSSRTPQNMISDSPSVMLNVPAIISTKPLISRSQLIQGISTIPTQSSESALTKPMQGEQSLQAISVSSPSSSATSLSPHIQMGQPLISTSESSTETISNVQTVGSSEPTVQRMHFIKPQVSTMGLDKSLLNHMQSGISSESTTQQNVSLKSMESITPAKISMSSVPYIEASMLRMNLMQSIPPQKPLTQSMSQLSTMTSDVSKKSIQGVQSTERMPLLSVIPSESNQITTTESNPPTSLLHSVSSMMLTSPINAMQPISPINSLPSISDSLEIMSSNSSMDATDLEIFPTISLPISTTPPLYVNESDSQSEIISVIGDHASEKNQRDFDNYFTPDLVDSTSQKTKDDESAINLAQPPKGSQAATLEIHSQTISKEMKQKPIERFSLKTSIPISKIDMKCVSNPAEVTCQSPLAKKTFNFPQFTSGPSIDKQKSENVLIQGGEKSSEGDEYQSMVPSSHSNISTLISAAKAVNVKEKQFRKPEPKKSNPIESKPINKSNTFTNNKDVSNLELQSSTSDTSYNDKKNQIVFIQNKSSHNKKMILTIKQQTPQVPLKGKNLQAPSQISEQQKICKEEVVTVTEHIPSRVVPLKPVHPSDYDEDDFENLITENQIYGNKIVVKEKIKGISKEQKLKRKNEKTRKSTQSKPKNLVKSPNFVYVSNVKYPPNVTMYKNKTKASDDLNKEDNMTLNENKITESHNTLNKSNDSMNKPIILQNIAITTKNQLPNISKNSLSITKDKHKVITDPKTFRLTPKIINTKTITTERACDIEIVGRNSNKTQKTISQNKPNDEALLNTYQLEESGLQPKVVITDVMLNTSKTEKEVSSLDIYAKRKKLLRIKHRSTRDLKDIQKSATKKTPKNGRHIITPEKMKAEIFKEFTLLNAEDEDSEIESDYEGDELKEYESIIQNFGPKKPAEIGQIEFLSNFMLGTPEACKEILWNKKERVIQRDRVASAYIAAGRLDRLINEEQPMEVTSTPNSPVLVAEPPGVLEDSGTALQIKQIFMSQLKLKYVKPQHRAVYEATWQEILKERKRRNAPNKPDHVFKKPKIQQDKVEINTNSELQILSDIKNSVTENNNLIKKRLDSSCQNEGDSIKTLAEKNFSELNRLSMMADRSVKHFSGQDVRTRDLNPGFDSENIQNPPPKLDPPIKSPKIKIPNVSKITSLKTTLDTNPVSTSQATSMDEPENSAAGVDEMFSEANIDKYRDIGCQAKISEWPGIDDMIIMYKEFERERKKEFIELTRRNRELKLEGTQITRITARHSDRARGLITEKQNLIVEGGTVKDDIQRLFNAVDVIRNYF